MCLGIPGEIVELFERHELRFGEVRFGGVTREVCLEYQPDAEIGDFVLVHVGFAISTLDPDDAARSWQALEAIDQVDIDETGPPGGGRGRL